MARTLPADMIPHKRVNKPFRWDHIIAGRGITITEDTHNILTISGSGMTIDGLEGDGNIYITYDETTGILSVGENGLVRQQDLVAGDNIMIVRDEETGEITISASDTATIITNGDNIIMYVNEEDGTVVIDNIIDGEDTHYKGVFDSVDLLLANVTEPEETDYALIKEIVVNNGGREWTGYYKYVVYVDGEWVVVDQLLTFTTDTDLIKQYYSVGGKSRAIYLHEIARTGSYNSLSDKPIVATPELSVSEDLLTATCATPGAVIWYRAFDAADQSNPIAAYPYEGATLYTEPIDLSDPAFAGKMFRFVGTRNGLINSEEAMYSNISTYEMPEILLDWQHNRIYFRTQGGDHVRYTVDGSDPDGNSALADYDTSEPEEHEADWYDVPDNVDSITVRAIVDATDHWSDCPIAEATFRRILGLAISYSYAYEDGIIRMIASTSGREPESIIRYERGLEAEILSNPENYAVWETSEDAPVSGTYSGTLRTSDNILGQNTGLYAYCVRAFSEGWLHSNLESSAMPYRRQTAPVISSLQSENKGMRIIKIEPSGFDASVFDATYPGSYDGYNTDAILYTLNGSTPSYTIGEGGSIIPGSGTYLYNGPFETTQYKLIHAVCVCYGAYKSPEAVESAGGLVFVPRGTSKTSVFGFHIPEGIRLEYSIGGGTWEELSDGVPVSINVPVPIYLRGYNPNGLSVLGDELQKTVFFAENLTAVTFYGNITRLLDPEGNVSRAALTGYTFAGLFDGAPISRAPSLDLDFGSGTLPPMCYLETFKDTTILGGNIDIPTKYPSDECFKSMFDGSSVGRITVHALIWAGASTGWLANATSASGVIRKPARTSMPSGSSGVPAGWTVENI